MSSVYREYVRLRLTESLEDHCRRFVGPTFDGDPNAAFSLACALPNELRGTVAVALWEAKIPPTAYRAYLAATWEHDHHFIIAAAETRRRLAAMFRYAAFPPAEHLPDIVRVWRGVSGISIKEAQAGYSWATERDIACWFAMRFATAERPPLVLAADISREQVALYSDSRNECEVVLVTPPKRVFVDGEPADWQESYQRHSAIMREHTRREIA